MSHTGAEADRAGAIALLGRLEEIVAAIRQVDDARLQDLAITVQAQSRALLIALESPDPPQRMLHWL